MTNQVPRERTIGYGGPPLVIQARVLEAIVINLKEGQPLAHFAVVGAPANEYQRRSAGFRSAASESIRYPPAIEVPAMQYRKVYVAMPMDQSVVAAARLLKGLDLAEGEFRIEHAWGLSTLLVVPERAGMALDGLVEVGLLSQDEAWRYFIARPVEAH